MIAKKIGFGFGIAIILPLLIHYGVSTFSPQPKWKDYRNNYYSQEYQQASAEEKAKMTEERKQKDEEYRAKQKIFQQRLFFVAVPIGLTAIIVGSFLSVQAVGAGLIFGGIFTVIDGYCWYWTELQDWMRFVSLLIAFIILVTIGYKKLEDKSRK